MKGTIKPDFRKMTQAKTAFKGLPTIKRMTQNKIESEASGSQKSQVSS